MSSSFFNARSTTTNRQPLAAHNEANEALLLWQGILEQQADGRNLGLGVPDLEVVPAPVVAPALPAAPAPQAVLPVIVLPARAVGAEALFHHFNFRREVEPLEELIAMGEGRRPERPIALNNEVEHPAIIEQRPAGPVGPLDGNVIALPAVNHPYALFARLQNVDPAVNRADANQGYDEFVLDVRGALDSLAGRGPR